VSEKAAPPLAKIRELLQIIESEMTGACRKDATCMEGLLRRVVSNCASIASASKPWSSFKEHGRDLLSDDLKAKFDQLAKCCAEHGLCVNQYGELESLLVDQGIEYTTDKRAWIQRALALIPNLQVDSSKKVWTFLTEIHSRLEVRT
jgi:hypothetical protein